MKITYKDARACQLKDLKAGECFKHIYGDEVYIKIAASGFVEHSGHAYYVQLNNGMSYHCNKDDIVVPVQAAIVVEA